MKAKKLLKSDKLGLLIALLIIIIVFSILTGNKFFTVANVTNIAISSAIVGLVVIGECYLLIVGHVDLSPGSVAAFSGVLVSLLLTRGVPLLLAILIVLLIGLLIGLMNALLVNKLKLEPFIATLAAMSIFRGLAYIICGGKAVFVTNDTFLKMGTGRLFGVIPYPVLICIVFFAIAIVILNRTRFGRSVYMVGGNANAARLAGINAEKVRMKLYMAASALAALGGILQAGRMSSGQPTASDGLEFDAVTAVVLGGVAMSGGVGTLGGAAIGLIIMQSFNNGLMMLNVPSFWQTVSRGLLLIAALSFDFIRNRRRK
ncbi:MAG TPA: ABC transporter permease [Candidatus Limivivens merdigallinarum]|uniref:ABC transporter permease n=1 Tax=Candidatus Limivivens merdigallinarum TaxID=2840859 RepID=A0A9D0ZXI5_9FIRM|nr:ABC transporter permease [Candidatus Limivivens merdigallinarum]